MTGSADLAARFQAARPHLRAVVYRMLGSVDDAEDAVQEAWLRLSGGDGEQIANPNLDAWLTTVVARICLNTLRSRRARSREELVARVPDPIVEKVGELDPEHQAMLADGVGPAVCLRGDFGPGPAGLRSVQGASAVAGLARGYPAPEREAPPPSSTAPRAR